MILETLIALLIVSVAAAVAAGETLAAVTALACAVIAGTVIHHWGTRRWRRKGRAKPSP